jgi:hypothetical protein
MNQDDRFEDFVRSAIHELDPAPSVPRDEMWARIESARRFQRPKRRVQPMWLAWGAGVAAVLALGIGIGRISAPHPPTQQVATQSQPAGQSVETPSNGAMAPPRRENTPSRRNDGAEPYSPQSYRLAALQHLSRVELLITTINSGTVDPEVSGWAKDMLASTRMLMNSPAADDPRIDRLLQDLELILAQIAAVTPAERNKAELDLIQHGIEQTNVLPRLRATMPASQTAAGT